LRERLRRSNATVRETLCMNQNSTSCMGTLEFLVVNPIERAAGIIRRYRPAGSTDNLHNAISEFMSELAA
jgi:hypothetical protein